MNTPPKALSTKTVYRSKTFSISEERITCSGGAEVTKSIVRHPGAVVILPLTEEKKILLIRQYRYPLAKFILELAAGTIESNELPLACAQREIQEEIGYAAESWTPLGAIYPAPGFCDEVLHLFLARNLTPSKLPGDADEVIEVKEFEVREVAEAIKNGEICDAKTISAFTICQMKGYF